MPWLPGQVWLQIQQLVDAIGDLEQASDIVQPRLPPQAGIDTAKRRAFNVLAAMAATVGTVWPWRALCSLFDKPRLFEIEGTRMTQCAEALISAM